jgi:hypothetical protein
MRHDPHGLTQVSEVPVEKRHRFPIPKDRDLGSYVVVADVGVRVGDRFVVPAGPGTKLEAQDGVAKPAKKPSDFPEVATVIGIVAGSVQV